MFVGVHAMLAMRTHTPELQMSEDEAKAFARATQNVMRHYDVQTTQKTLDWISFAGITAGIYGTRALAISERVKEERRTGARGPKDGKVLKWPVTPRQRPQNDAAKPVYAPDGGDVAAFVDEFAEFANLGEPPGEGF
jgi:hypothetical protein